MWLLFCCVSPRRSVFRKLSGEVKSALQDFGRPAPWDVHVMGYVSGGAASLGLASPTVPVTRLRSPRGAPCTPSPWGGPREQVCPAKNRD